MHNFKVQFMAVILGLFAIWLLLVAGVAVLLGIDLAIEIVIVGVVTFGLTMFLGLAQKRQIDASHK